MAQSATTVTAPNPTPPTNFSNTGATPPNVPNYTKNSYANMFNMDATGRPQSPYGVNQSPPPYYDDGAAGPGITFAANTAALASGTSTTSGGTENTYPGTGSAAVGTSSNFLGAVPASTSVAHEGAGTELNVLAPGNIVHTYVVGTMNTSQSVSCGPVQTAATIAAGPNANHASSLSPATNPTLTSIATIASGGGNGTCTATGTGFTRQSVLNVNGISYPTTYTSATTISCTAPKKATSGTLPVYVITGGVVQTATVNWNFT